MTEKEYLKLTPPRRTATFGVISVTRSNLWLGRDHLLCVETEGYTEKYRRFYFRDIQAITLRRTSRATAIAVGTGAFTVLFALLATTIDQAQARWFFGILAGTCAIPLLINLVRGPTCKCELRTAVQTENVPSMSRVRRARKVLNQIRPLIAEAQGQLAPEDIARRFREIQTAGASDAPSFITSSPNAPPTIQP